jgi:cellulose synthase/poly-beta-1,6-N-acetylglucosamine synthase-like glycosyltransferase
MALCIIIILFSVFCYSLVMFLISSGVRECEISPDGVNDNSLKVSVIIPFRNEAENLPLLVDDLLAQTYPKSLYEVIFVNDHSGDESGEVIDSMISAAPGFSCLRLLPGSSGKKAALYYGIQNAIYDRLIQVDADCRVGPEFIASHMAFLEEHPSDLVAGVVTTTRGTGGFLEAFERLDLLALAGSGAGSFQRGRPMMCSGANLAYSRELYMETRSFDPVETIESGDDMFLMIGARKLRRTMAFNTAREACVETGPVPTLRALLVQRIRWGAKSTRYEMADIQLFALLVIWTNLTVLLMPLWLILFTGCWPWLAGALSVKFLADFVMLYRISGVTNQRGDLKLFLPVSLAYYPVFFMTLVGVLLGRTRWERGD